MDIWQEDFALRFGAVDTSDRLTPAAAFDLFQEAAINHAEALGVGRDAMAAAGRAWILSRISVLMDRRPCWREALRVRSWPRSWDRLFVLRDYDLRDREDRPVVRGRSCWLVLDREKRRPLRPQPVMEGLPPNEGLNALTGLPPGLEGREGLVKAAERKAAYTDIDYNGHVNNARYIQWVQDICEPEFLEKADLIRLDVNYLSEVKFDEVTELWQAPLGAALLEAPFTRGFAFEGRRKEDGAAAFRIEIVTRRGGDGPV